MHSSDDGRLGVYVHVPFCERVCPYCDFAVVAAPVLPAERERGYVEALLAELERRAPVFEGRELASLYLGGGTPSLLTPDSVARLREGVERFFPAPADRPGPEGGGASGVEVTLEVNPSTVERERLPAFRAAGVNRLSVGTQSFDDLVLRRLGRAHRADEGRRTLAAARTAGFRNLSLDLLFAAPDGSLAQLRRDLDEVIGLGPEHVSVYELTLEPGTPFHRARDRLKLPNEDEALGMFELIDTRLEQAGIRRYELSNFARPGSESVHNRRYWERQPVLGLGVGAWSTDPRSADAPHGVRRANARSLDAYLESARALRPAEASAEVLAPETARGEAVFLGLRRTAGLSAASFAAEFGAAPRGFFEAAIAELTAAGLLLESSAGDLTLTPRGRLLSDSVFEYFV